LDGAVVKAALTFKGKAPDRLLNRAWSLVVWTLIQAVWDRGFEVSHRRGPIQTWNDMAAKDQEDVQALVEEGLVVLEKKVEVRR
jgi:hypothetical protein